MLLTLALAAQSTWAVLTWTPATDDVSPQTNLVYEVRQSPLPNIGAVEEAELNGTVALGYGAGRESATIFDLQPGTYYFTVIVKDEAGNKAAYQMTSVTIPAPLPTPEPEPPPVIAPQITQQPATVNVKQGQVATFSVTATGSELSYQWKRNGLPIPGATAASFALLTAQKDNNAKFAVTVSNLAGSVTSNTAALHVKK